MRESAKVERRQPAGWLIPALILIVALLPRLAPLHRYVTPDEPAWVLRSILFREALLSGQPGQVPATGHPGVTTMWLGSLGVQIHSWLAPDQAAAHLEWLAGLAGLSPKSPASFRHLAFFLPAGRVLVALATSLGVVGVYTLARRLCGRSAALLASLLLALDPFLIGHSGLLHVDGLLATTMILSALAGLLAIASSRNAPAPSVVTRGNMIPRGTPGVYGWAALSGLLAGLAGLTKTPGGLIAPFFVLLLLLAILTRRLPARRAGIALLLWGGVAGLVFLTLYPALWASPLPVLRGLLDVGGRHVEGALRPIFFRGEMVYDPGAIFYPVVALWRTSPLVPAGLVLALALYRRHTGRRRLAIAALLVLALGFGLLVTLAGKKHDRYLLPAFPALTLVAALGWDAFGRWFSARRPVLTRWRVSSHRFLLAGLLLIQLLLWLPYRWMPLAYFNPLAGGPRVASRWLPVDWGEGLGVAARWLNRQPDARELIVASPSLPPLASLFVGQTVLLDPDTLAQADYVVYPSQQEADISLLQALSPEAPALAHAYQVGGIRYGPVWQNPLPRAQTRYLQDHTRQEDLILLDADGAVARLYEGEAEVQVLGNHALPDPSAAEWQTTWQTVASSTRDLWYVALPAASPITARQVQEQLACLGHPARSEIVGGARLSRFAWSDSRDPAACLTAQSPRYLARFQDLAVRDAVFLHPDDAVSWPDAVSLVVRWEALAPLPVDYRAVLYLQDQAGRTWIEGGQEILGADYRRPSAWAPGEGGDQTFHLALPAAIPPGRYTVTLGVFEPASGRRLSARIETSDGAEAFAGLAIEAGAVTVRPPTPPPSPWDVPLAERFDAPFSAGPLLLLGQNPPPAQLASGDRGSFDLLWSATAPPQADYALAWQLVDHQGAVALSQQVPLSPYPTSRWRAQELQQVRYDLPVPPELPAGTYRLTVNVVDGQGTPLWPEDLRLASIEILDRARQFSLPPDIDYPLDVQLGQMQIVRLRGFDLDVLAARPGEWIPLTLYWQASGPTALSYTVFVHLLGPDGMLHGQVDRLPAGGAAPTHTWAPGQVVVDALSLPVQEDAPPGVYHIAVGLYDVVSGERLPVYDASGTPLPDSQLMLPVEIRIYE